MAALLAVGGKSDRTNPEQYYDGYRLVMNGYRLIELGQLVFAKLPGVRMARELVYWSKEKSVVS
jgi:hypothetical protein